MWPDGTELSQLMAPGRALPGEERDAKEQMALRLGEPGERLGNHAQFCSQDITSAAPRRILEASSLPSTLVTHVQTENQVPAGHVRPWDS